MNAIVKPITPDGRTGFDEYDQLMTWSAPDAEGRSIGRMIKDVRGSACYICGRGWGNTSEELTDQTQDNDGRDMHRTCIEGHYKINAREKIQEVLIKAGFLFHMAEVPPRYPNSTPWQRVTVLLNDRRADSGFRIVLGRRKRVWELRLHNLGDFSDTAFADVTDTKGYSNPSEEEPDFGPYFFVHAYTPEQMVNYLKRFHSLIPAAINRD